MPTIAPRLKSYLDQSQVDYETIQHVVDFTAQETAADTHTPGVQFAKTVLLDVDGKKALAVLPAHHKVDTDKLQKALGARKVHLCSETEMGDTCPDCDAGAIPPFGNLYDLPVFLSNAMIEDDEITFNAGTHRTALRMRFRDYRNLVHPEVLDFSWGA